MLRQQPLYLFRTSREKKSRRLPSIHAIGRDRSGSVAVEGGKSYGSRLPRYRSPPRTTPSAATSVTGRRAAGVGNFGAVQSSLRHHARASPSCRIVTVATRQVLLHIRNGRSQPTRSQGARRQLNRHGVRDGFDIDVAEARQPLASAIARACAAPTSLPKQCSDASRPR